MGDRDGDILDLVGLHCPLPALKTRRALARMAPGAILVVRADDPLAALDIPHLVAEDGHVLSESRRDGTVMIFVIERGAERRGG